MKPTKRPMAASTTGAMAIGQREGLLDSIPSARKGSSTPWANLRTVPAAMGWACIRRSGSEGHKAAGEGVRRAGAGGVGGADVRGGEHAHPEDPELLTGEGGP